MVCPRLPRGVGAECELANNIVCDLPGKCNRANSVGSESSYHREFLIHGNSVIRNVVAP
jgi:hypothetical protein